MRFIRPLSLLFALTFLLSACVFGGGGGGTRDAATRHIRPRGAGPVILDRAPTRETRQCYADLNRMRVDYTPLPDMDYGSGCLVTGAVTLNDLGIPVSGLKAMKCPLARAFTGWVRFAVVPAARQILGSDVVRIVSYGTFSCRGIIGGSAASARKLSQHALADAVDIGEFVLADGRRVTVKEGWNSPDSREREFMRIIHASACKRFTTVLSPDYNAAHRNHLHFDLGGSKFCR